MGKPVESISGDKSENRLLKDLERYQEKAIELGADKVTLVRVENIPVDERVTLKCQIPRCFGYGVSAHCPPNTLKPAELRELLKKYTWAVFFIKDVPPEVIIRDKATIKERVAVYQEVYKIVSAVESRAFYDGHYLAFGFGAGSCRHTFCGQQPNCQALEGATMPIFFGLQAFHGGCGYRCLPDGGFGRMGHLPHWKRGQGGRYA